MKGLRVREATATDLDAVVRLERTVAEAPHWTEREYAAIVSQLGRKGDVRRGFFVAEAEGRIVGFAVAKAIGSGVEGGGELESVVVEAKFRRMGVARGLCREVVAWCLESEVEALDLEVRAGSVAAIALYRSLGFAQSGCRSGYYQQPEEDALLMRLDLARDRQAGLPPLETL